MSDGAPLQVERAEIIIDKDGIVRDAAADGGAQRFVDVIAAGARIVDHLHAEDRDLFSCCVERTLREGRAATIELRWTRRHDHCSKLMTIFSPHEDGVRITLSYGELAVLRRAEEEMRRVVEGSAQGIVVRTRTQILYLNESFAKMTGYNSARECMENAGQPNDGICPEDLPRVLAHMEARIRGEEAVSNYEFRLIRRDGSLIWVEVHASNVSWKGKPASLSWLSDITRRKTIEEELRRSQEAAEFANRSKTQFLANMSHELRTPLNAILGFSEAIEREMFGPVSVRYLDYARDIHRSGRLLLELVNDVLDLSKLEAGKLELHEENLSLAALVQDCVTLLRSRAKEGRIRLVANVSPSLPCLRADARSLKQLLLNFMSNAVKFTPEGGTVRIEAACDLARGFSLSVSDTGIGMSAKDIEVALSPFGQVDSKLARKHEGTGLGLPICRSLVELHGGEMTVESAANVGTTVTARFPVTRIVREAAQAS